MKYQVTLTEPAASSSEETASWWATKRSAEQASRWYDGIRAAIASLGEFSERCARAAENSHFPRDLRELYFGHGARPTHRIVFAIVQQSVIALAVRHVAQSSLRHGDLELPGH